MKVLKDYQLLLAAIAVALGLCYLGCSLGSSIERFKTLDRHITVKGLSEREVPANKVTWPLM